MTQIQAIIFDLDDTLYPERDYVRSGFCAVGEHLRKSLNTDELYEDWLWNQFLLGQAKMLFNSMSEKYGLELSDKKILELVMLYREHRPDIKPYAGVVEMLGLLHSQFKLGLLSDGFLPAQELKLEVLKLERFFDTVVFTEKLGREAWKPSVKGFELISKQLIVAPQACAYVGDNLIKDFVAPNKLGWLTILYIRPEQVHTKNMAPEGGQPKVVVRSPEELRTTLIKHS